MIFDEITDPDQLRAGMQALLEEAQAYGISMWYTREPDDEYLDWTVAPGRDHTPAIIWMFTEYRYQWLFSYHKMMWHRCKEFTPCTDEGTA